MKKITLYTLLMLSMTACVSLVKEDQLLVLKEYEKSGYITKKEIIAGAYTLPSGKKIKLVIKTSGDWIKVYGYDYNVPLLQSERALILYLFQEDFPNKKFSKEHFIKMLSEYIRPIGKTDKL